jgi:ATP-dependent DNA ligase
MSKTTARVSRAQPASSGWRSSSQSYATPPFGRCESWLKIRCTTTAEFAVTGFDPNGRTGVRSLAIAEARGARS